MFISLHILYIHCYIIAVLNVFFQAMNIQFQYLSELLYIRVIDKGRVNKTSIMSHSHNIFLLKETNSRGSGKIAKNR